MYVVQIAMKIFVSKKSETSSDAVLDCCCFRPHRKLGTSVNTLASRLGTTVFSELFSSSAGLFPRSLKTGDWRRLFWVGLTYAGCLRPRDTGWDLRAFLYASCFND